MKGFDIHCHYNHGVKDDHSENVFNNYNLDFLKEERLRLNVKGCALCSYSSVLNADTVYQENEHLFNVVNKDSFFYQWVVVDPRQQKTFDQAKEMLKSNSVIGVKIHISLHQYDFNEYSEKIFDFVDENKTTLLMHPDCIDEAVRVANKHKDVKLIIAHLGSGGLAHINAVKNAKYNNIYVDTSGSASFFNNVIEYSVNAIGEDKILFGTDTYSCAFQKGRIEFANITEKQKQDILYNNAFNVCSKLKNR